MHYSRLGQIIIDTQTDDLDAAHRFCVVRPQHDDFPAGANRWD